MLRFPIGQAHLWQDGEAPTLIDAGHAGSAAEIGRAYVPSGGRPNSWSGSSSPTATATTWAPQPNSPAAGAHGCWRTAWARR